MGMGICPFVSLSLVDGAAARGSRLQFRIGLVMALWKSCSLHGTDVSEFARELSLSEQGLVLLSPI